MKRNKFSLSHYKLSTMSLGYLYPMACLEVLPGDTFQHSTNMLLRCIPLVAPVMHPCHVRIHHWFVPHRIIWDNWENFITGGPDGMDASTFPTMTGNFNPFDLGDYFGVRTSTANVVTSALPFRAYALIFNEWYRDQDLVTPLVLSKADGNDTTTNRVLQQVAWEKDYYTTARPWTQKGPIVTIPLTGNAPVTGIGLINSTSGMGASPAITETQPSSTTGYTFSASGSSMSFKTSAAGPNAQPDIFANLSAVSAADIDTLRKAFALQRYEEARARYGSRYTEYLRYLGVRSSDARLQRPEYLGGGKQTIQFSEVLQTGGTSAGAATGVGNLAGHGIAAARSNRYRRFFEEHGYVITCVSVKPRTIYSQGQPRSFMRRVKEDFWQKELEHIGQQPVLNGELYLQGSGTDTDTFGYQDRYDEYRREESRVSGQFRPHSDIGSFASYDYWHFAREFGSLPVLNSSFVQCNAAVRPFAQQSNTDTILAMISHSVQARRMLSKTGTSFIL